MSSGRNFCYKTTTGGNDMDKMCMTIDIWRTMMQDMPNLRMVAEDGCYTGKIKERLEGYWKDAEICLCSRDGCNPAMSISDFYSMIIALTPFIIIIKTLFLGLY